MYSFPEFFSFSTTPTPTPSLPLTPRPPPPEPLRLAIAPGDVPAEGRLGAWACKPDGVGAKELRSEITPPPHPLPLLLPLLCPAQPRLAAWCCWMAQILNPSRLSTVRRLFNYCDRTIFVGVYLTFWPRCQAHKSQATDTVTRIELTKDVCIYGLWGLVWQFHVPSPTFSPLPHPFLFLRLPHTRISVLRSVPETEHAFT